MHNEVIRQFKCKLCKSAFATYHQLCEHKKAHYEKTNLPCDFCSVHCSSLKEMKEHLVTHLSKKTTTDK